MVDEMLPMFLGYGWSTFVPPAHQVVLRVGCLGGHRLEKIHLCRRMGHTDSKVRNINSKVYLV